MLNIEITPQNFVIKNKVFPFGETLLDFISIDMLSFKDYYATGFIKNFNMDDFEEYIFDFLNDFSKLHPYFELMYDIFRRGYTFASITAKTDADYENAFYTVLQSQFNYFTKTKNEINKALDYCLSSDDALTAPMRLFVYMYEIYEGEPLENLAPESENVFPDDLPEDVSIAELSAYVLENNLTLKEYFKFYSIEQICVYELIKMINLEMNIKKCKFCGSYFIPKSRSDAEYCDRIKTDETKSCAEIGPMRMYQYKTKDSPVYAIYNKAYKRNNSRVRSKKITQSEFLAWSDIAREKRDLTLDGKIQIDEFEKWCNSSR